MEFVIAGLGATLVTLIGYFIMKESDDARRHKEYAAARIKRMQAGRERAVQQEYERQRHTHVTPRSAPVTTGKPATAPVTTRVTPEVKRRDNSFDNDVDSGWGSTYTPSHSSSHSSSNHSSHSSCSSSSSSDSSSSSSDSGGGGCD